MIQHAQAQHDVEGSQRVRRQLIDIQPTELDSRAEQFVSDAKPRRRSLVDGDDLGAAALALEAEDTVVGADIQNTLASKIRWYVKTFEFRRRVVPPRCHNSGRELDLMKPRCRFDLRADLGFAERWFAMIVHAPPLASNCLS